MSRTRFHISGEDSRTLGALCLPKYWYLVSESAHTKDFILKVVEKSVYRCFGTKIFLLSNKYECLKAFQLKAHTFVKKNSL